MPPSDRWWAPALSQDVWERTAQIMHSGGIIRFDWGVFFASPIAWAILFVLALSLWRSTHFNSSYTRKTGNLF